MLSMGSYYSPHANWLQFEGLVWRTKPNRGCPSGVPELVRVVEACCNEYFKRVEAQSAVWSKFRLLATYLTCPYPPQTPPQNPLFYAQLDSSPSLSRSPPNPR
jgi:hypothetical protein